MWLNMRVVFLDEDMVIPVVQKRDQLPSPSISSSEGYDGNSPISASNVIASSPRLPTQPLEMSNNKSTTLNSSDYVTASSQILDNSKTHNRVSSDKSEQIKPAINPRPDSFALRSKELSSKNLFYTPENRNAELRRSLPPQSPSVEVESPSGDLRIASLPIPIIEQPDIVPNVPKNLPLKPTTPTPDVPELREHSPAGSAASPGTRSPGSKSPVRRTSSNDPAILRRGESKTGRVPDLLSP